MKTKSLVVTVILSLLLSGMLVAVGAEATEGNVEEKLGLPTYILDITIEGEGTVEYPDREEYGPGEHVTLTATADDEWFFDEWTGDHEGEEKEITIVMDKDKEITAYFDSVGSPQFPGYDPMIHSLINQTIESNIYNNIDTLQNFENEDGVQTRRDGTMGFWDAVDWTYDKFNSFGLDVFKQDFTYHAHGSSRESTNVIAELPGSDPQLEGETYIIGGHLDSINWDGENESAPGADDNGSGVAVTLEAARILSQYEFSRTIRFAAWGAEEFGLYGSSHYASNIDPSEEDMRGKFNYDMVGYEEDGMAITHHANAPSNWMLDYKTDVAESYDVDVEHTYVYDSDQGASDHASFWEEGYNATLSIETEFNPYYHTSEDTLDKLTVSQIEYMTKHAIGTVGHLADPVETNELTVDDVTGEGTVEIDGEEVTDTPFEKDYELGEEADLLADPAEGWYFSKWTGDVPEDEEEEENITIVMDEDKEITAHFEEYVDLAIEIEGEGAVEVDPDREAYERGVEVNLTAVPDEGWYFEGWTGDTGNIADPNSANTYIKMENDYSITANFGTYGVEVTAHGDEVTVTDDGDHEFKFSVENLGSVDDRYYLSASSSNDDWSATPQFRSVALEAGDDQKVDVNVTISSVVQDSEDSEITLTAESVEDETVYDSDSMLITFKEEYELTVEEPEGEGVISVDGYEITDYPYTEAFLEDTIVELLATPDENWYFDEWIGDVPEGEEGEEITITMDDNREITAVFEEEVENYGLTLDVEGEGTVDVDPEQDEYENGTVVTLEAVPADGWEFEEWQGTDETGEEISITMDEDKTLTAHFEELAAEFEVNNFSVDVDGLEVTITADVENIGGAEGSIDLEIGGEVVDTLTLGADETEEYEYTHEFDEDGEYTINFFDDEETVNVEEVGEEEEEELDVLMIAGIVVLVVIILTMIGYMMKDDGELK